MDRSEEGLGLGSVPFLEEMKHLAPSDHDFRLCGRSCSQAPFRLCTRRLISCTSSKRFAANPGSNGKSYYRMLELFSALPLFLNLPYASRIRSCEIRPDRMRKIVFLLRSIVFVHQIEIVCNWFFIAWLTCLWWAAPFPLSFDPAG